MRRRKFIGTVAGAFFVRTPLAYAQPPTVSLIGILRPLPPTAFPETIDAFKSGLAELGYVEGRNLIVEHRWSTGQYEQLPALAAELVALIGPNGAGKTTFVSLLSGRRLPQSGTIRLGGEDITRLPAHARVRKGIAYTFQITSIYGNLTANGQVWIINQNGIIFGGSSQVNVGSLVASSLSLSNQQFMAGINILLGAGGGSRFARGLHPAILTDRGLVPALTSLANRAPFPVEITGGASTRLPEAVEAAVKLARVATGRPAIMAFRYGYHGRTAQTMALTTAKDVYRAAFEPLPGSVYHTAYPYCYRAAGGAHPIDACTCDWEAQLDLTFHQFIYPDRVAAIIVEPVLGNGVANQVGGVAAEELEWFTEHPGDAPAPEGELKPMPPTIAAAIRAMAGRM